ncbi:MAG: RNA polymerase sigma-70 factor [Gemmatimonadaceae bacterium]|nr:RNA polymerase sigma-70 factor [Gemmatimonadaceae bacterium]
MDDRELLRRLRLGDEAAFDVLFRQHYAALVGFAESLVGSRAVAEDLVQDVLLEVWRRRETLHIDVTWRSYLFRATRNRALNEHRHARVARRVEPLVRGPEFEEASSPAEIEARELDVAFRRALAALPAPVLEVFELSRRDGLKYGEIASALGISVKTVEARMGRALKELREQLRDWLPSGR